MRSLAAVSVACYVLQVKDRHNGNILLDGDGALVHIDFGFLLTSSPANAGFETAPFKLTYEYVEALGGFDSPRYLECVALATRAFLAVRRHWRRLALLVDSMRGAPLDCFCGPGQAETTSSTSSESVVGVAADAQQLSQFAAVVRDVQRRGRTRAPSAAGAARPELQAPSDPVRDVCVCVGGWGVGRVGSGERGVGSGEWGVGGRGEGE